MCLKAFFFTLFIVNASCLSLPSYIRPCKMEDSKCIVKVVQEALPQITEGDKKYNLPPLNPFTLPKATVNNEKSFKLEVFNSELFYFNETIFKNFTITKDKLKFGFFLNRFQTVGDYQVEGKILVIPINGNGKANITTVKGDFVFEGDIEHYKQNNKDYIKVVNNNVKYAIGGIVFDFDNLFNGDPVLGPQVNKFLNENWADIITELDKPISQTFATIIASAINGLFSKVPYNELFLESE